MEHKYCPGCENKCALDALKCGKGRNFFGVKDRERPQHELPAHDEPNVISLIRRCGKFLHRGITPDTDLYELTKHLSDNETAILEELLEKCLAAWQNDVRHSR